jgi:hypothetical protein|nr:MAG TPA: hypothetical protein [Caudoviricetes sp.]
MAKKGRFLEIMLLAVSIAVLVSIVYRSSLMRWVTSESIVSGIVYNSQNDVIPSGNTYFSVRASENTVVTEENKSEFCLPPNSPYIKLVNEAAKNKNIKVVVTSNKVFTMVSFPWQCVDNVKVERLN